MSNRNIAITVVIIVLIAVGIWGVLRIRNNSSEDVKPDQQTQTSSEQNATSEEQQKDQTTMNTPITTDDCTRNFSEETLKTATVNLSNQVVTLEVKDYGMIKIQLFDKDAPKTVENFLRLTNAGYYDCLKFHRVAKGFVVQTGDPNGDGTGGFSAFGSTFADELNANTPSYKTGYVKGVVAMANRGPNTNGSQFFITLADLNANLPKNYTIFGKVISGLDIVEKIGNVQITPGPFGDSDGSPVVPVVIKKATISK